MSKFMDQFRKKLKESIFCYAKPNGEGFVSKNECQCYVDKKMCCQAFQDREKFHSYFKGLGYEEAMIKRKDIIESIRDEFKDSQWYNDNVVE